MGNITLLKLLNPDNFHMSFKSSIIFIFFFGHYQRKKKSIRKEFWKKIKSIYLTTELTKNLNRIICADCKVRRLKIGIKLEIKRLQRKKRKVKCNLK